MASDEQELPELLVTGPQDSDRTFVFAHGAGAPMDTEFMEAFATGLAANGVCVVRFEFPYMAKRREDGKRRPPNRAPVLEETFRRVLASLKSHGDAGKLFIGGKSMGGRIASMIAVEEEVTGVVCLGYPFHPTGKPEKLRVAHLQTIQTPVLIVQGDRDPFGNAAEVATYDLSQEVQVHWLTDGDHSFKPRKASGVSLEENYGDAIAAITRFIESQS